MKKSIRTEAESAHIHQKYHRKTRKSIRVIKDNNFTYRLLIEVINRNFKNINKMNVLDVGCGAGSLSFYLASKGARVVGIDISSKAVLECRKSSKTLNLDNTKFFQTYFPSDFKLNNKFDYVIFTEVIEHLEDDELAVRKISSILKKGGILILSTPSIHAPLHKLGLTKKFDKEVGHLRRYDLRQLKNLLKSNGFKIIETKKTEGILRNFLFIDPIAGKLIRVINRFGSDFVTFLDHVSLRLFGESNYIIVAKKKTKN